jgi:hypothetical protein
MDAPPDPDALPAELAAFLYDYQVPHVETLYRALKAPNRVSLLEGSGTGLGKTHTTCVLARWLNVSLFVISPISVLSQWFKTAERVNAKIIGAVNYESFKNGKYYLDLEDCESGKKTVCPYMEVIYKTKQNGSTAKEVIDDFVWRIPDNTLIVFDEAHRGKNGFESGQTVTNKLVASARAALSKPRRKFLILLSATITDKLDNADFLTYTLGMYQPYTRQAYKRFEGTLATLAASTNHTMLGKLHELIFPTMGSSMPPLDNEFAKLSQIRAKIFRVSPEVAREIEEKHRKIRELLAEIRAKGPSRGFGLIIRSWQQLELLKVPVVVEWIWRKLSKGRSVMIFTNFDAVRNQIHDTLVDQSQQEPYRDIVGNNRMGDLIVQVHGGQAGPKGQEERRAQVAKFQADKAWVILVNIRAGGVGISLHPLLARGRRVAVFPTWCSIDLVQVFGRGVRAGMTQITKQRVVYCSDRTDEEIEATEEAEVAPELAEAAGVVGHQPHVHEELVARPPEIPMPQDLEEADLVADPVPEMNNRFDDEVILPPPAPAPALPANHEEIVEAGMQMSVELMLCRNVRAKLANISELNTGFAAVMVENFSPDEEV